MLTKQEAQRDKRYQRQYGLSLAEYKVREKGQGYKCRICGRPPKKGGRPLHVEHSHAIAKLKVMVLGRRDAWQAFIPAFLEMVEGSSRSAVTKAARQWLLAKSYRGLTCWHCNQILKAAGDDSARCYAAGKYLDSFREGLYNI